MRMTKIRENMLADLKAGAYFMVTQSENEDRKAIIAIIGGGKYNQSVVEQFFIALRLENRLVPREDGLFPGCSQCFSIVQ